MRRTFGSKMKFQFSIFRMFIVISLSIAANVRKVRGQFLECDNKLGKASCKYFAQLGLCDLRRSSMEKHCARACGFCTDPPCNLTRHGCCLDGKTTATGPHMQGCKDDCRDMLDRSVCKVMKRNGDCLKVKAGRDIRRKCAVTCGFCRPCVDDSHECYYAAMYGGCKEKLALMANTCRKTCNLCGTKDPCSNHMCPKHSICQVQNDGKPYCQCDGRCHKGDVFTGVVCGRDGNEYSNLCELKKRNCGHPSIEPITVKRFGKCEDHAAALLQPSDRQSLCKEDRKESSFCVSWAAAGFCATRKRSMQRICPKACNFCAVQAAKPACHYSKHGCCLDNKTTCLDNNYKGCPKYPLCEDSSELFCKRFVAVCGAQKHKSSMKNYCPKTCALCG